MDILYYIQHNVGCTHPSLCKGGVPMTRNEAVNAVRDDVRRHGYYIDSRGPSPILIHGLKAEQHDTWFAALNAACVDCYNSTLPKEVLLREAFGGEE